MFLNNKNSIYSISHVTKHKQFMKHMSFTDTQEKTLDFTILWLPDRFYQLWLYLYVLGAAAFFSAIFIVCSICTNNHIAYSRVPI